MIVVVIVVEIENGGRGSAGDLPWFGLCVVKETRWDDRVSSTFLMFASCSSTLQQANERVEIMRMCLPMLS